MGKPEHMPTQAEIESACVEFQSSWSDAERARRSAFRLRQHGIWSTHLFEKPQSP